MFFQIAVTPKAKKAAETTKEAPEPQAVLVLAPFQPQPRLKIESTIHVEAKTSLIIKNTSNRSLNVKVSKSPPEERSILLSTGELSIPPESESTLWLSWTPREAGSWRDTLQLTDNRRLKYDIPLTTLSLDPKRSQKSSKPLRNGSQRVLAPSNDNYSTRRPPSPPPRKNPQKVPENKENFSKTQISQNSHHLDIFSHSKPLKKENFSQNSDISGIFDISSFQLTPLKPHPIKTEIKQEPMPIPDFEFSPRDESIISQTQESQTLRRETYLNSHPRFCRPPPLDPVDNNEENFDDSLSPRPSEDPRDIANFSALMNNIAQFATPQKSDYLGENRFLTVTKSSREEHVTNTTFEIIDSHRQAASSEVETPTHFFHPPAQPAASKNGSRANGPQQRQSETDNYQRRLGKTFEGLSPVMPARSSPIRASSSPIPSIRNGDNATVKQVIEADLWIKSSSLESIPEEVSFRPQTSGFLNLTGIISTPLGPNHPPTVFEVSPTKRTYSSRPRNSQLQPRTSPKKLARVTKERIKENQQFLKKKMHSTTQKTIPGVRITKLSLSKLHKPQKEAVKPTKEQSIRLYNPNDLVSDVFNPDPFAATMTEDPFLASTLYYDEKWMYNQELEFKKWLNALLTPPEHLNADVDTMRVDVGKVWQSCRGKEVIPLAETREAVSARYHTNHRLNTLRKAALAMFNRPEVRSALSRTIVAVERGNLVIRQDRDLHRDIGLQKEILELFFSYNPLWLRIGLEVVYAETIPLSSNNDLVGLTKFLINRFFSDPFLVDKYSLPNVTLKAASFMPHLNKFILKKFLLIVFFLDYAKRNKLIGHDPCLFHKKAVYKESREILLNFSRQTLSGVGDVTKVLRPHGYIVSHKQTYLDEYDYAVKDLSIDLRDGVRLCRVMELIIGDKNLTSRCRVPAISRLQKVHNAELALTALNAAGYVITGDIDAKSVADGHREKTLSLLWQIIYRFQAPRFAKAAKVLQKWWRAHLCYVFVRNFLKKRRFNAAVVIQCCWRSYKSRKLTELLREKRREELKKRQEAAKVVQTWWRSLKDRRHFLRTKNASLVLQRCWRRYSSSKPYLMELQRKKEATVMIQRFFRSYRTMKRERINYLEVLGASCVIQKWYRAVSEGRRDFKKFQDLKKAVIVVQTRWRARKLMEKERNKYLEMLKSAGVIQNWWRRHLLMKKARNDFIIKKHAVKVISLWYKNVKLGEIERKSFLKSRESAIVIQRCWRRWRETKDDVQYFKEMLRASVMLQTWWRRVKAQKNYQNQKKSAIVVQKWYRSVKLTESLRSSYLDVKKSAIVVQKTWKMKRQRKNYLEIKKSVSIIENWYLRSKKSRTIRNEFLSQKKSAICIQQHWRSLKLTKTCKSQFLELRKSAIVIQKSWRSLILTRNIRNEFLANKSAIIRVQAVWRMLLAQKRFRILQKREKSAIIIQKRWRARNLGGETRKNYEELRNSCILIQRKLRATLEARVARNNYLLVISSAVKLQRRWRAQKSMKEEKNRYLQLKKAAIRLQALWRMRKAVIDFKKTRRAVLTIQTSWRSFILAQKIRTHYLNLKKSAIFVQKTYKSKIFAKTVRNDFLKLRKSALLIQITWRAKMDAREQEEAAIILQTWWRSIRLARRYRIIFEGKKKAAILIQAYFRSYKETRRVRNEFNDLRSSTIVIQRFWRRCAAKKERKMLIKLREKSAKIVGRWWRAVLHERRVKREEAEKVERWTKAAVVIQTIWRGHSVRKEQCERTKNLRLRAKRAAEAAVPSTTIAYRLQEAMNGLMNFSNIGQLTMCLACIDTLTRLSIRGCILFCELDLVEKVYDLLEQSNRSLPWMDVCTRSTNILITLAKLPDTAPHVRRLEYMETVARLMNVTVKNNAELFLNLATLLWVLLLDEEFEEIVVNDHKTAWLVKSACSIVVKREGKGTPMKKKNNSMERIILLPNTKPDWGLATKRPRCFVKVEHAVFALAEKFKICNL